MFTALFFKLGYLIFSCFPYFLYLFAHEYFIMPKSLMFLVCQGGIGVLSQLELLTGILSETFIWQPTHPLEFSFLTSPRPSPSQKKKEKRKEKGLWKLSMLILCRCQKTSSLSPHIEFSSAGIDWIYLLFSLFTFISSFYCSFGPFSFPFFLG